MMPKPTLLMKRWQAGFDRHRDLRLAGVSTTVSDGGFSLAKPGVGGAYSVAHYPYSRRPPTRSKTVAPFATRAAPSSRATRGNSNFFEASLSAHLAQPRHSSAGASGFLPIRRLHSQHELPGLPSDCEAKVEEAAARLTGKLPWPDEEPLPLLPSRRISVGRDDEDGFVAHTRHRNAEVQRQYRRSPGLLPLRDLPSDDEGISGSQDLGFQYNQLALDDDDGHDEGVRLRSSSGLLSLRSFGDGRRRMPGSKEVARAHHSPRASRPHHHHGEEDYKTRRVAPPGARIPSRQMHSLRRVRSATPPRVARAPRRLAVPPSGAIRQCRAENNPLEWSSEDEAAMQAPAGKRMRCDRAVVDALPQPSFVFSDNPFKQTSKHLGQCALPQGMRTPAATQSQQSLPMLGLSPAWE